VPTTVGRLVALFDQYGVVAAAESGTENVFRAGNDRVLQPAARDDNRLDSEAAAILDDVLAERMEFGAGHQRRVRSVLVAPSIHELSQVVRQRHVERQHEYLLVRSGKSRRAGSEAERFP
jgi:hypothetical protein